ncbi:hypothetical protein ACFVYA_46400 [Amycolatopsis sp. NPDC058278]|uniref:hypothetical protein n=1 Tax=Amycolatopsis sp. NPDC058278 TaxID=3346417 RepID=UPI0036D88A6B
MVRRVRGVEDHRQFGGHARASGCAGAPPGHRRLVAGQARRQQRDAEGRVAREPGFGRCVPQLVGGREGFDRPVNASVVTRPPVPGYG